MKIRKLNEASENKPVYQSRKYSQESFDKAYEFLKDATDNFTKEGRFTLPKDINSTACENILSDYYESSGLTGDSENPTYPEEVRAFKPVALNTANEAFDVDKVQKRIARHNEFDNGHVLHNYEKMTSAEAEEKARLASIENPDDIYYVSYDDIMNPSSDIKWKNGQKVNESVESKFTLNEALFNEDYSDDVVTLSRYLDVEVPDICGGVLDLIEHLPSHKIVYITKICRDFYAKMESIIKNYTMTGDNFDESLQEDVTDVVTDTLSGPTEGPESGLSALLNEAVQDEFKTIQMYNDIAVSARAEGFEDIATVVDEINTEENKHVGQLQELLKTVSPNAKAIDTGEIEGQQQIGEVTDIVEEDINNSNSSPNNNIEEDGKDMKESWEEVYQSFKTIEKELNGDGEAITATIDQLYRDNKGNPDYEKAYKKWASGE